MRIFGEKFWKFVDFFGVGCGEKSVNSLWLGVNFCEFCQKIHGKSVNFPQKFTDNSSLRAVFAKNREFALHSPPAPKKIHAKSQNFTDFSVDFLMLLKRFVKKIQKILRILKNFIHFLPKIKIFWL